MKTCNLSRRAAIKRMLALGGLAVMGASGSQSVLAATVMPVNARGSRWIEVSLSGQRLRAWEGDTMVMESLCSTGVAKHPTITGNFRVYNKLVSTRMKGEGYDLAKVPHTMYYYGGYAIHGAYWHNKFGRPMSHGCVNLPLGFARQLFNWSYVGIPVRIRA